MKKIKKKNEFEILSKGQKMQIKGGGDPGQPGCGCCICAPNVKGAGDATAIHNG